MKSNESFAADDLTKLKCSSLNEGDIYNFSKMFKMQIERVLIYTCMLSAM